MKTSDIFKVVNNTDVLKGKMSDKWGVFSAYFQIRKKLGVKVILHWCLSYYHEYKTKEKLFSSRLWKNAVKEFEYQKLAFDKLKCVPRVYNVRPIFLDKVLVYNWWDQIYEMVNGWFPAIWMEHIEGMRLDEFFPVPKNEEQQKKRDIIIEGMKRILRKEVGLRMIDLHQENIIVKTNKAEDKITDIKVIDFSPTFVRFVGRKTG